MFALLTAPVFVTKMLGRYLMYKCTDQCSGLLTLFCYNLMILIDCVWPFDVGVLRANENIPSG